MANNWGPGNYPPPYGPGYNQDPMHGITFGERLQSAVGRNVTVYLKGDDVAPVRGLLNTVGCNFIEVNRVANEASERVIIPLWSVVAII